MSTGRAGNFVYPGQPASQHILEGIDENEEEFDVPTRNRRSNTNTNHESFSLSLDDEEFDLRNNNNNNNRNTTTHNITQNSNTLNLSGSVTSFTDGTHRSDPNYLFEILMDASTKQTESAVASTLVVANKEYSEVWERVRRWLWANSNPQHRQTAAGVRGDNDETCLHLVCKFPHPPDDIVFALVEAAPDTVQWVDSHGWLPLHHACANGASPEVMQCLVDSHPAGRTAQDQQNRTPLHFYATRNTDKPATMAINVELLTSSTDTNNAAALTDKSGMLPIHYACAYGTNTVVLKALAKAHPASLTAKENNGRTPMHLAMVNAHRDESPQVIRFLLDQPDSLASINTRDQDGYLPMHLLAIGLKGYRADPDKRANVSECLTMYLAAEPRAGVDFLTVIQDLPDWLQDTAVVSKHVRTILNEKIVQRFPTSILMLDGIFLVVLIISFAFTTRNHIDMRFDPDGHVNDTGVSLVLVFVGATYFLLREIVQFASLMSLGSLSSWWSDPSNYLDMSVIVLVFYYGILMLDPGSGMSNDIFRSGVAFTQGTLWVAIILYLKSTLVDFAVFVGGVFYVVQRLVAFLIAVGVILLCFAQMFYFVYIDTNLCVAHNTTDPDLADCRFPHCTFEESLLKVYTMMMGEIGDETRYSTNLTAQILYVGYAFLVVILLSNVLIAIVTDSYEIIQNDRAAIVFWSNRLDFVAEMDAITYAIQRRIYGKSAIALEAEHEKKHRLPSTAMSPDTAQSSEMPLDDQERGPGNNATFMGENVDSTVDVSQDTGRPDSEESTELLREAWHQVMLLFDANLYEDIDWIETGVYNIFRLFSIFFVIPLWITAGAVSAGWLWPPQIREYLFVQKETAISRAELERQKLRQLQSIGTNLKSLKQELLRELANDRDEMIRMKADVEAVQGEVYGDLQQIKELIGSLLAC